MVERRQHDDQSSLNQLWRKAALRGGAALKEARKRQFAANVRNLCRRRKLSLKDASKLTGVNHRLLRRWASAGISKPDKRTTNQIEDFANFFGVSVQSLWDEGGNVGDYDSRAGSFGEKAHRLYRAFNNKFPRKPSAYGSPPESMPPGPNNDHDRWLLLIRLANYFDNKLQEEQADLEASAD